MKDVESLSDGRIRLGTGTLYGALGRLLAQGWIERRENAEPEGRPRKDYALTDTGRRILAAEISRLESVVAAAWLRMAGGTS